MTEVLLVFAKINIALPLQIIGGIATTALIIGTVVAYSKAGTAQATIDLQKTRIDTLEGVVNDKDRAISDLGGTVAALKATSEHQAAEIVTLRELATGSTVAQRLVELASDVRKAREEDHAHLTAVVDRLERVVVVEEAVKSRTQKKKTPVRRGKR